MMTLNTKYVKLWKIHEKPKRKIVKSLGKDINFPKFQAFDNLIEADVQ